MTNSSHVALVSSLVLSVVGCGSDPSAAGTGWSLGEASQGSRTTTRSDERVPDKTGSDAAGDAPSGSDASTISVAAAIEDYCDRAPARACRRAELCEGNWLDSYDLCVARAAASECGVAIAASRGTLEVDADRLVECGELDDADPCAADLPDCYDEALNPLSQTGEVCFVSVECEDGICLRNSGEASCDVTAGICGSPAGPGGDCTSRTDCLAGLECSNGVCREGGEVSDPCSPWLHCRPPLVCVAVPAGSKCAEPLDAGKACTPPDSPSNQPYPTTPCTYDHYCDRSDEICRPRKVDGEVCATDDECKSQCIDGRCGSPGTEGAHCVSDDDCFWPLRCERGTCAVAGGRAAEECRDSSDCHVGLECIAGECSFLPTHGDPCAPSGSCAFGSHCADGLCVGDWQLDECAD